MKQPATQPTAKQPGKPANNKTGKKRGPYKKRKLCNSPALRIERAIALAKSNGIVAPINDTRTHTEKRLDELQNDCRVALAAITPQQRRYVNYYVEGMTHRAAGLKAGYSQTYCDSSNSPLRHNSGILNAIKLIDWQYQLANGISLARKRSILMHIADVTTDEKSEQFQPSSGVAALRLIAELDRDIKVAGSGSGTVQIVVQSGIPSVTIDGGPSSPHGKTA